MIEIHPLRTFAPDAQGFLTAPLEPPESGVTVHEEFRIRTEDAEEVQKELRAVIDKFRI